MIEELHVTLQRQLADARASLSAIEELLAPNAHLLQQREKMTAVVRTLEELLSNGASSQASAVPVPRKKSATSTNGALTTGEGDEFEDELPEIPLKEAVLEFLRKNPRRIWRTERIWEYCDERGCKTSTRPAHRAVRYALYSLLKDGYPIKHLGRNQWRYVG